MKTSEVLEKAADRLDYEGHCKGRYRGLHGGYCTAGAIAAATGLVAHTSVLAKHPAISAVATALGAKSDPKQIAIWNDAPERTKDEVVAMLRAVAASERAREASPVRMVERVEGQMA